jgi:predicted GH43/DUF377 family glycosyl hydrolase
MRWRKLGLVYCPPGDQWWARAYAHLPTPELLDERTLRVYFAGLDEHKFGRIGFVDLDPRDPLRVLRASPEPVLDLGPPGCFDDSGVNPSCVVTSGSHRRLYYIGWQRAQRVPYMLFSGLAVSETAGAPLRRVAAVPVLDRTPREPYSRSAPCVRREGATYRVWYWSCQHWSSDEIGVHYNNVIRYAESHDGISWKAHDDPVLVLDGADDYSAGRPWVIRDPDGYRMWYSIRSRTRPYRLGYAESANGLRWARRDADVGLDRSATGWDSEMVCYPAVIDVHGGRLLFYNGNRHGATGFGVAVLEG